MATVAGSSTPAVNALCDKVNDLISALNAKDVAKVNAAKAEITAANMDAINSTIGNSKAGAELEACKQAAGTALRQTDLNLSGG